MPARRRPARRPRRGGKKMMRKGSKGGKLAVPRAMRASPDQYAKVIESFQIVDSFANTAYGRIFTLNEFDRASKIASNYKWYKAAKVTWTYTPLYNTFQDQPGATVSKPQIYFSMNRTQDNTSVSQGSILAQGSRPQQFTSNKVISYVPNWCSPGLMVKTKDPGTGGIFDIIQCGVKAQTDWLSCPNVGQGTQNQGLDIGQAPTLVGFGAVGNLPDNVVYNGHVDYIYQENSTEPVYSLICTVEWLFKQPLFLPIVGAKTTAPALTV